MIAEYNHDSVGHVALHQAASDPTFQIAWATDTARAAGQVPVLDVGKELHAAVALYEAVGWRRVGEFTLSLKEGDLDLWVYVGP